MGEILSQAEIDALLQAMNSGDMDVTNVQTEKSKEKQIKNYNFARPSKFGKEQLRTLEIIFDSYSRLITSFLTGYLRVNSNVEVASSEQLTYSEFTNSLSNPVIFSIVDFHPFKGSIVLDLSPSIGYSIIDRILGGPGASLKKLRDFSEIEKILLERIILQLLSYLKEPFENLVEINPKLDQIETNPQFAQIMSPNEMVALITLLIKIGDVEGYLNFCIPHLVIEPIVSKLNTKFWFSARSEEEDAPIYKENIEKKLETTKIPIKAIFGKTNITVNDFVHLQQGDIIALDSYINSDIDIIVGNLLKFQGKPGVRKNKNAIQITSIVRKEE